MPFSVSLSIISATLLALCVSAQAQDHTYGFSRGHHALALSPDAKRFAVAGSDGVLIYSVLDGRLLEKKSFREPKTAAVLRTDAVAWARDGRLAASGLAVTHKRTGFVCVWDTKNQTNFWTTGGASLQALSWSSDGKILATASASAIEEIAEGIFTDDIPAKAQFWNPQTRSVIRSFAVGQCGEVAIGFSADGKRFAISREQDFWDADDENANPFETITYETLTGKKIKHQPVSVAPIFWGADGFPTREKVLAQTRLSTGALVRAVRRNGEDVGFDVWAQKWDGKAWKDIQKIGGQSACVLMSGEVLVAPYSTPEDVPATFERNGTEQNLGIWRWNNNTPRRIATLGERRLAFSRVLGTATGTIGLRGRNHSLIWGKNRNANDLLVIDSKTDDALAGIPFSLDANAKTLFDGRIFQLPEKREIQVTPVWRNDDTIAGTLSPDGSRLVLWSGLLNIQTGTFKKLQNGDGTDAELFDMVWSPDGSLFGATVSGNESSGPHYVIWDNEGKPLFKSEESYFKALAFLGKTHVALSETDDNHAPLIQLRNIETGQVTGKFSFPRNPKAVQNDLAHHIEFSSDNRFLAVAGIFWNGYRKDGAVLVFETQTRKLIGKIAFAPQLFEYLPTSSRVFAWTGNDELVLLSGRDQIQLIKLNSTKVQTHSFVSWKRVGTSILFEKNDLSSRGH